MRVSSEYLRLLAWMAGGGAVGVVLGVTIAAFTSGLSTLPFLMGAFCSYLGMLVGDRRRLAARRAARSGGAPGGGGGALARKARRIAREARRRP